MPHTVAKRSPLIETRRLLHVITLDHVCICHSHSLCHALWFWMLLGTSSLIHKLMFQPLPPWFSFFSFSFPGTDESEEQNQTSCLVYLEERDKCGFRLFQGTHINHAWEGALGVGRSGGGGGAEGEGGGGVCLPGAHSFHSLQNLWKCPLHTLGSSSAKLRRYVSGDKMPACRSIVGSETCDVIQRCWADKPATCKLVSYSDSWPWPCYKSLKETPHISLRWHSAEQLPKSAPEKRQKRQFMQQKKLFIWDTHCQYKLRDHKTYTFQLFFFSPQKTGCFFFF